MLEQFPRQSVPVPRRLQFSHPASAAHTQNFNLFEVLAAPTCGSALHSTLHPTLLNSSTMRGSMRWLTAVLYLMCARFNIALSGIGT